LNPGKPTWKTRQKSTIKNCCLKYKDLQSQIGGLQEQTKAGTETLRSEIKALESEIEIHPGGD
jgi:uncharacterized protein YaaN involved in tellurite resistance